VFDNFLYMGVGEGVCPLAIAECSEDLKCFYSSCLNRGAKDKYDKYLIWEDFLRKIIETRIC